MHRVALVILIGLVGVWGSARADTFSLDPKDGKDTVYFRSTAKLEFIEGNSSSIGGAFSFEPDNTKAPMSGIVEVDLRTLKTGIETRDGHMRDRHLHTDKYPSAFFQLVGVSGLPDSMETGKAYSVTSSGYFFIHGGKRKIEAPTQVILQQQGEAKILTVRPKFSLKLDDYHIERPKALFLKLAETIDIELIFVAYNNLPATEILLPDWAELK